MDKNSNPSLAMVTKLMKANGYFSRFDDVLKKYPSMIAAPFVNSENPLEDHYNPEEILQCFHGIYSNHLTADEILEMIAFYKTPTGKKLVETDEKIRVELHQATVKMALEIAAKILKDNVKRPPEDKN